MILPASILTFGIGQGVVYPVFVVGGLTGARPEEQGLAAGIQSTSLQVGGGLAYRS